MPARRLGIAHILIIVNKGPSLERKEMSTGTTAAFTKVENKCSEPMAGFF